MITNRKIKSLFTATFADEIQSVHSMIESYKQKIIASVNNYFKKKMIMKKK